MSMPMPTHLTGGAAPISETVAREPPLGIEELFREHSSAIASLGLAMLQNVEEADDLVQDVFLRAWRALDRLEDRQGARPWLMTIAIRLARTRLRRRKLTRLLFRVDEPAIERVAAPGSLPEHRDLVKHLYRILDQLPVELRIAWVLRHVQEETVQTVADICGWSLSTAKRRIQLADARVSARLNTKPLGAGMRESG
jgi:RNA polymerase sigma-70 factor (ECF subfamily)